MGATPIAAKAAIDAEIAKNAGMSSINGLGCTALDLGGAMPSDGSVPYEKRLIGAAEYVRMFGIPEVTEFELRDQARYTSTLDPDIACKMSWSMSIKLMTQRQRNYQRALERIERSGWHQQKRSALKKFLGFEWPW